MTNNTLFSLKNSRKQSFEPVVIATQEAVKEYDAVKSKLSLTDKIEYFKQVDGLVHEALLASDDKQYQVNPDVLKRLHKLFRIVSIESRKLLKAVSICRSNNSFFGESMATTNMLQKAVHSKLEEDLFSIIRRAGRVAELAQLTDNTPESVGQPLLLSAGEESPGSKGYSAR